MTGRRCGVTSIGGALGCCRPEGHAGACCAHDYGTLTGQPGRIVTARSRFTTSYADCAGNARPVQAVPLTSRGRGNPISRLHLPTEGTTP